MGAVRGLRDALDPLVAAAHPVPKIALLPLAMIVLGVGEPSRVAVVALAAFFPMVISTAAGVRQISPVLLEVAENYGASPVKLLTRVLLPGALPVALSGLRLAINTGLLIAIAVEFVAAQRGLGAMLWLAWQTLRVEEVYAAVAVIAAIGWALNGLLATAGARLQPWRAERRP
jgi:NitT/TauT family transport system permease protein